MEKSERGCRFWIQLPRKDFSYGHYGNRTLNWPVRRVTPGGVAIVVVVFDNRLKTGWMKERTCNWNFLYQEWTKEYEWNVHDEIDPRTNFSILHYNYSYSHCTVVYILSCTYYTFNLSSNTIFFEFPTTFRHYTNVHWVPNTTIAPLNTLKTQ